MKLNKKPKKILIDGRVLQTDQKFRGIGIYSLNLIKNILLFDRKNSYFLLVYKEIELPEFSFPNLSFIELTYPKISSRYHWVLDQFFLPFKLAKLKFDLIHFLEPNYPLLFAFKRNFKSIVTIYDVIPKIFPDAVLSKTLKYKYRLNFFTSRFADKIITISYSSKNDLIEYLKIPEEKIEVVYPGIDSIFKPANLKKENFILFVGVDDPRKNVELVLIAFTELLKEMPRFKNLKLLLTGKRTLFREEIKRLIELLKIKDKVIFSGFLPSEKFREIYQKALFLVFPSLYEGFGLPPLEAMACGTPVICSNTSSLPEICEDAVLYIDPKDKDDLKKKMISLLTDKKLYQDLVKKGFERVKKYRWEDAAKQTIEIYKKLIDL